MNTRSLCPTLLVAALAACSSGTKSVEPLEEHRVPTGLDDLVAPDDGFQLRSVGADIAPGEDVEYCEIGELPGDPSETYYVKSIELANAKFSHHLVVATAKPGSAADARLRELDIGDKVTCNGANFEWPEEGLVGLASAQTPYFSLGFPDGVGTVLSGNERVVFDYHYVNTSDKSVRAESAFNVHVVDGASIEHIATAFSFFNFTIDIPAHAQKSFTAESHFTEDLKVANLVRHTHEHGRDFSVWYSGGPNDGEHIWTSGDWKHDTLHDFPEPITVNAGDGFRFSCDFENQGDAPLRYGIKGTDEMCILAGFIWSAGDAKDAPVESRGITWIDDTGIGHPATENGGFPPASPTDAALCAAGISLVGAAGLVAPECGDLVCSSCGSILLKCVADSDCAALIGCLGQDCGTEAECIQACERELHDHSSAVGLMEQVQGCMTALPSACAMPGK
jgi:hypothetical protein